MSQHSFAIVGAGNITSLRHIPALRKSGRATIAGVIDRNVEKARAVANRFGIPHAAAGMDEPWFEKVDAVTIGVPPAAHGEVAEQALLRGKHVLLEKPMTLRMAEAERIVSLAAERRKILAIVQNFQFASSATKLKRLIRDGKLGDVRGILCFQTSTTERRLPVWHEELPLGLFYDEAPHLLYLLKAFGGENLDIQSVHATPSTTGRVTPAVITAHIMAGKVPAVLYNNFEAPVSEWHFTVYGTKMVGIVDVFRDVLVTMPNDGQHLALDVLKSTGWFTATHLLGVLGAGLRMLSGNLLYGNEEVVRRFLDAIESGTPPRDVDGTDGLAVLRLQHELVRRAGSPAPP